MIFILCLARIIDDVIESFNLKTRKNSSSNHKYSKQSPICCRFTLQKEKKKDNKLSCQHIGSRYPRGVVCIIKVKDKIPHMLQQQYIIIITTISDLNNSFKPCKMKVADKLVKSLSPTNLRNSIYVDKSTTYTHI